jgi:hypothetical protein
MDDVMKKFAVITTDTDWATEKQVENLIYFFETRNIPVTIFTDKEYDAIKRRTGLSDCAACKSQRENVGPHVHLVSMKTGSNEEKNMLQHAYLAMDKDMRCMFSTHAFVDSHYISKEMHELGFKIDRNLCTWLQPQLQPIMHESGLWRVPVWWEDDVEMRRLANGQSTMQMVDTIEPGLKVLNVHPQHLDVMRDRLDEIIGWLRSSGHEFVYLRSIVGLKADDTA